MAIMKTMLTSFLLATLLATTLALPTEEVSERGALEVRGKKKGSSKDNPKRVEFDNSAWYATSEEDCYVYLCSPEYAGEHRFQKQPDARASRKAYEQGSRAKLQPFQNGGQKGGEPIAPDTTSPEDIPQRSLQTQGKRRYLAPTRRGENSRQGTAVKEGYRKAEDGGLGADEWAEIHMKGNLGPCCRAWEVRDFSACADGRCAGKPTRDDLFDRDNLDISKYVYHATRQGGSWGFQSGFGKRDVPKEPELVSSAEERGEKSGEELVNMLREIARKRDEEDARQARKREEEGDSHVVEKRDADDDYIAAGFELDLEDLE